VFAVSCVALPCGTGRAIVAASSSQLGAYVTLYQVVANTWRMPVALSMPHCIATQSMSVLPLMLQMAKDMD